jgi:hypothetical protein
MKSPTSRLPPDTSSPRRTPEKRGVSIPGRWFKPLNSGTSDRVSILCVTVHTTEPESPYSERSASFRTLRGARYGRSLLLTCTPGPARGTPGYGNVDMHGTCHCPVSSDETGRNSNWTKNMPPVQSQASCVGARAIVWIAETLLLATEGFVDAPSSFVQFRRRAVQFRPVSSTRRPVSSSFVEGSSTRRPVSSSFVIAPSEISAPCARLRQLRQRRGQRCASALRAPPKARRAVRR